MSMDIIQIQKIGFGQQSEESSKVNSVKSLWLKRLKKNENYLT